MTRTSTQTRSKKQLKAKTNTLDRKQSPEIKTTKKVKDGWEMTAREALQVNFVVSEI